MRESTGGAANSLRRSCPPLSVRIATPLPPTACPSWPIWLLIALVLLHASNSQGAELQAEYGQCRFGLERDGVFYQADRHTDNFLRPPCVTLGIADKWKGSERFGWRVAFVQTGSIQARDNIATIHDDDAHTYGVCDPLTGDNCIASFNGSGRTYGISASLTAERRFGAIKIIGETGLFFFHHSFRVRAKSIDCPVGVCYPTPTVEGDQSSNLWDMPNSLAGITLRYRDVYLALRHYWSGGHRALSLTDHSFTQLMTGIAWRF